MKNKRQTIKQLLNRQTNYTLGDYVRKVSKEIGKIVKVWEITGSLKNMQKEGQLLYHIDKRDNNRIYGFLIK